jgi:hypothetical protein
VWKPDLRAYFDPETASSGNAKSLDYRGFFGTAWKLSRWNSFK